jgi:uncharacterized membrane protein SpoIIM required for sporulation
VNVAKLLEERRRQWSELEQLCGDLEVRGKAAFGGAASISRFATLYRAACADLALAASYQLPPTTVEYLHRLVGRAHNQLYRSSSDRLDSWWRIVMHEAPRAIFADGCVRIAALVFFGLFTLSMVAASNEAVFPGFAESVLGSMQMQQLEEMYEQPLAASTDHYVAMSAFYIKHNTSIGLQCFAWGVLLIPCLVMVSFNAVVLGASFGFMARPDTVGGDHFFEFVTAHGPFELTAIALSAAAGLRLGIGFFATGGLRRSDALRQSAVRSLPIITAAVVLFVLAAFTEGFISPSPLPYVFKAAWAVLSSGLMMFYFVVLGFPRGGTDAAR